LGKRFDKDISSEFNRSGFTWELLLRWALSVCSVFNLTLLMHLFFEKTETYLTKQTCYIKSRLSFRDVSSSDQPATQGI